MIKAGIIGSTGYAGAELVRLLKQRDDIEIVRYGSHSYTGQTYQSMFGNFYSEETVTCGDDDMESAAEEADVLFTATPQGYCSGHISESILKKCRVIDLSGDFRFDDVKTFESWYGMKHGAPELNGEAVYGLPELYRDKIASARLVANPGCYPTCSILSIYPLVKAGIIDPNTVIDDAKSGTTGAGRGAKVPNLFCEVNESIKPYGVASHRHTPEIEEQLAKAYGKPVVISFTPHLVPMMRGILVTAYASLTRDVTAEEVRSAYEECYSGERFVRMLPENVMPQTNFVEGSNFVYINFKLDPRTRRVVMCGAIDNLVKGAAGQAVQNMNIMLGLKEDKGLEQLPLFP